MRRWEAEEDLPIHRHPHKRQGSVYAYKSEIDTWLDLRSSHSVGAVHIEIFSPLKEEHFIIPKTDPCKHALVCLIYVASDCSSGLSSLVACQPFTHFYQ